MFDKYTDLYILVFCIYCQQMAQQMRKGHHTSAQADLYLDPSFTEDTACPDQY